MQATFTDQLDQRWVLRAVARDGATAERWSATLDGAGIDVEVRIGDAVDLTKGSSMWPIGSSGEGHQLFAFPLFVPADRRDAAATVLVDHGWNRRFGEAARGACPRFVLRGALFATLAGGAVALLLLWRGL